MYMFPYLPAGLSLPQHVLPYPMYMQCSVSALCLFQYSLSVSGVPWHHTDRRSHFLKHPLLLTDFHLVCIHNVLCFHFHQQPLSHVLVHHIQSAVFHRQHSLLILSCQEHHNCNDNVLQTWLYVLSYFPLRHNCIFHLIRPDKAHF